MMKKPDRHRRAAIALLSLFLLLFVVPSGFGAIPLSINYQGFLGSNSGVPVDGSVNIVFRIYSSETATTALWSNSQSVVVQQGVFSVQLGDSSNPFPINMFDNPLWLGLTVGSDNEMTPRRAITNTAFSYKAQDADMLDGSPASAFDQSAHLMDTGNPHGITPTQIGASVGPHTIDTSAATLCGPGQFLRGDGNCETGYLDADGVDAYNSAYDTEAEIDAAVSNNGYAGQTAFTIHIADPAAHHPPYNDSDAVAAMLANDGAGSQLDSDKLDGLEASEIIDASQDEVRMPISSLPRTISQPGSYYLTGNLDGSPGGIDIVSDNVTLDLMGFTIDGGGANDIGIYFDGRNNVTIRNGTVTAFALTAIYQGEDTAENSTIVNVHAMANGGGIITSSRNSLIRNCVSGNNAGTSIAASGEGAILLHNTAYGGTYGYGIFGGDGAVIEGNTVYNHTGSYAIRGDKASRMSGNTVYDNSATGIFGDNGSMITGNTVYGNSSHGIRSYEGVIIKGNTVYQNDHWGIFSSTSCLVQENVILRNNLLNSADEGGLRISGSSRIIGNTLRFNRSNNVYVFGSGSTLEENLITQDLAETGIFFHDSGNFYGNNKASGNGTDYDLNGTTQSTNVYMPNIGF